jgi:FixJ family two-component response regulator
VRQTALDAGALAFLAKPFDDEFMVQLVRKAFGPENDASVPPGKNCYQ